MDSINSICLLYKCTPLDVLRSDADHFVMIVNYLIMRGDGKSDRPPKKGERDSAWMYI